MGRTSTTEIALDDSTGYEDFDELVCDALDLGCKVSIESKPTIVTVSGEPDAVARFTRMHAPDAHILEIH